MAELEVAVTARAAADRVGPYAGGVLRLRTTRPPADGEANDAVRRLVAGALAVSPTSVRLVAGRRGRRKKLAVDGLDQAELAERLQALDGD